MTCIPARNCLVSLAIDLQYRQLCSLQVNGRGLFPGAGMLEAAFSAAASLLPDSQASHLLLSSISLFSPIILPAEVSHLLSGDVVFVPTV